MSQVRTISFWRGRLPHWEVADASYFVTLRLAGTLPARLRKELDSIFADVAQDDYLQRASQYFRKMDAWLDRDRRVDWLVRPSVAEVIQHAFSYYASIGVWRVHAHVIMPNHLHWFFTPTGKTMSDCVRGFKRFVSRQANALLGRQGTRFWQIEWFDHWSRSVQESRRIVSYIENNPVKAQLVARAEEWPYASRATFSERQPPGGAAGLGFGEAGHTRVGRPSPRGSLPGGE